MGNRDSTSVLQKPNDGSTLASRSVGRRPGAASTGKKKNPCLESQTGTPIEKHVSGVYSLTLQRRKERAAESEMKLKIKRAIVIYDGTP